MEDGARYLVGFAKAAECGAGAEGSPGFQAGNTCGAEKGGAGDAAYGGKSIRAKVVKVLRVAEDKIRDGRIERAVAFDKSGKELLFKSGDRRHVSFTRKEVDRIREYGGVVFTHNHPSGNSFSVEDVLMAREFGLAEIRAVAPDGTVYRIRPPNDGWATISKADINDAKRWAFEEAERLVRPKLEALVMGNILDADEASRMHTHWEVERMAKRLGLEYERVLGTGVKRAGAA